MEDDRLEQHKDLHARVLEFFHIFQNPRQISSITFDVYIVSKQNANHTWLGLSTVQNQMVNIMEAIIFTVGLSLGELIILYCQTIPQAARVVLDTRIIFWHHSLTCRAPRFLLLVPLLLVQFVNGGSTFPGAK
jgi:hypothetical protein